MRSLHGKLIRGLGDASATYFNKPLAALSDHEFAGLVAMVIAPNHYNPIRNPSAYEARLAKVDAIITGRCKANGWLDVTYEHCIGSDTDL